MLLIKLFGICKDCGHREFICHAGRQVIRTSVKQERLLEDIQLHGGEMLSGYDICELFTSKNFHKGPTSWSLPCSDCEAEINLPETSCFSFIVSQVGLDEWSEIIAKEQHAENDKKAKTAAS
jgi:hypothetical protein